MAEGLPMPFVPRTGSHLDARHCKSYRLRTIVKAPFSCPCCHARSPTLFDEDLASHGQSQPADDSLLRKATKPNTGLGG